MRGQQFWDYVEKKRQDLLPENLGWNYITRQYLLISDYAYARQAAIFEGNKRRAETALNTHQASWRPIRPWGWADHLSKLRQAYQHADNALSNHIYYWPSTRLHLVKPHATRTRQAFVAGLQQQAGLGTLGQHLGQGIGAQSLSGQAAQQWWH